jgi:putative chitinase
MNITRAQILAIMPNAGKVVDKYLPYLNRHMEECEINTRERVCHFLATIAVESSELRAVTENLNYSALGLLKVFPKYFNASTAKAYERQPQKIANRVYANRYGNGNEASGDGWRFRGRGLIQYTFRDNYKEYSRWCGYNVENDPDLLTQPKGAVRSACHCFQSRGCNQLADKGGSDSVLIAIRKKINGGTNGLYGNSGVKSYYQKAKKVIL